MPDSAPTGRLAPWVYDEDVARVDLDALEALLAAREELSERDDILPFLRAHPHLCALIGSYNRRANVYDRLGLEVPLFGHFTSLGRDPHPRDRCPGTGRQWHILRTARPWPSA